MTGSVARGLRRIVDVLQRGLFEADEARLPEIEVAPLADLLRHPRANRELALDGRRVAFLLKRSRRRSIGFIVGAEGLAVSAPRWVTLRDIEAAVREKGGWIVAKLDEQRRARAADRGRRGSSGRRRDAAVPRRSRSASCSPPVPSSAPARCGSRTRRRPAAAAVRAPARRPGARRRARAAPRRRPELAAARGAPALRGALRPTSRERLGVRVTRLALSSAQTRWGSASADGAIRLHWRLIQFPLADHRLRRRPRARAPARDEPRAALLGRGRSVVPDYRAARRQLAASRSPPGTDRRRAAPPGRSHESDEPGRRSSRLAAAAPGPAAAALPTAADLRRRGRTGRRRRRRAGAPAGRANQSACRWAIDSPMREGHLVQVERPAEEHRHEVERALRRLGGRPPARRRSARRDAPAAGRCGCAGRERPAVRRQHQHVGGQWRACARSSRGRASASRPRARCR